MTSRKYCYILILFVLVFHPMVGMAQPQGSPADTTAYSGSLGLTNNGFSIIPSFSLNSSAYLLQLRWKKKKISIDPDVRLSLDGRKGSMIYWLRYYPVEKDKFSLRMGIHPSFLFQIIETPEDPVTIDISRMTRFIAWEFAPNVQITKDWGIGFYYLNGNALQSFGAQTTHFVNLNTNISNIKLGKEIRLAVSPAFYYLNLDGYWGNYFTGTASLSHTTWPFTLQGTINQTFTSDLPDNKDFLWNISLYYQFNKKWVASK